MAVRANRYYNDPGLGQGFANLAQMFKPPSGAEIYGYARATAAQEELARERAGYAEFAKLYGNDPQKLALARAAGASALMQHFPKYDLYGRSTQPGVDPSSLDPSVYAVYGNAGNTFKGQREAQAAQMQRTQAQQTGQNLRATLTPIGANSSRHLPPDMAKAIGVQPIQLGPSVVNPGQIVEQPSADPAVPGRRIEGTTRPQSRDQVVAQIMKGRFDKDPNDPVVLGAVGQGITPVQIIDPTTNTPRYTSAAGALGQRPVPKEPTTQAPTVTVKRTNGETTTAIQRNGKLYDTNTQQEITDAAAIVRVQGDQGLLTSTTKNRVAEENAQIATTENLLGRYEKLLQENPGVSGALGAARRTFQQLVSTGDELGKVLNIEANQAVADLRRQGGEALAVKDFDPNLDAAEFLRHVLAYRLAKMNNPSGEVGVRAYEANKQALSQGMLTSNTSALARVGEFKKLLADAKNANAVRAQPVTPGQPAPAASPAPATTPTIRTWNPNTGALE